MNRIKEILLIGMVVIFAGCSRHEQHQVTVDAMDARPIVITTEGQLLFESKPVTQDDLIKMVKERVEKDRLSPVPSQYSMVLLEPDPRTPYGKVREIQDLIMENGGHPGTTKAQPTPGGDSLKAAPQE